MIIVLQLELCTVYSFRGFDIKWNGWVPKINTIDLIREMIEPDCA
jgi:hypothetical protein